MKPKHIRLRSTTGSLPASHSFHLAFRSLPLLLALALAAFSQRAEAVDKTWNVASGNWDVGSNWLGGTVPTSADNAYVDISRGREIGCI